MQKMHSTSIQSKEWDEDSKLYLNESNSLMLYHAVVPFYVINIPLSLSGAQYQDS